MTLKLSARHIVAWVVTMTATIGGLAPVTHAQQNVLTVADLYDPDRRIDFASPPSALTAPEKTASFTTIPQPFRCAIS